VSSLVVSQLGGALFSPSAEFPALVTIDGSLAVQLASFVFLVRVAPGQIGG